MRKKELADKIISMAAQRGPEKTVCPSEIAREVFPADWRKHMQEIRDESIALQAAGKVMITQKGRQVDPHQIKGPIRIRIV